MQQNFQLAIFALVFSFSFLLQTKDAEAQILINEVCSSNASLIADSEKGKYGDWIELLSTADDWIDLGDYYLTDDSSRLDKWKFPSKTYIGKNMIRFVFADGLGYKLHTNFKIEKKGEWLAIVDSTMNIVDSISVPYLLNDMSYGRLPLDYNTFSVFKSPTPDAKNLGTSSKRIASFVRFSISGGMYSGPQKLALSYPYEGNTIYYTLDGSYPTISSLVYNDTLELNKTSVIRAICFEAGTIPGLAVTQTYFIDEPQNLPIFSLVTDSVHLFSDETGIMVEGTAGVPGYCTDVPHNLNQDWERPVNLEFFEDDGTQVLNQECGTKIFGGCSRIRYPEKSLAFFARSRYETSSFTHQLFPDKHAGVYETFILRASGDDQPWTIFRDALTQTLVKDVIDVDVQGYRPVVLYINGDYWGIINMREKLNEHYAANNYDIDSDSVSVLRRNPESGWNTIAGSADHYNNMMTYIRSNDLTKKTHYDYVSKQMDMDEYINYQIIQIFFGGRDWPGNNIKFWRSTEAPYDKWRWILYDLDGHSNDAVGNIMEEATELDCD
ncbi:MAG: CotH kinase family protein, partial [Bacteroidales bacterium]|nr:CotH kinase family protein [Bacteroidales bacterium]